MQLIYMRLSLRGFIVIDWFPKAQETIELLTKAAEEGKINIRDCEQVIEAKFEDVPKTWLKLFEGGNTGKLVTKVA